jgi:hypothetical protein
MYIVTSEGGLWPYSPLSFLFGILFFHFPLKTPSGMTGEPNNLKNIGSTAQSANCGVPLNRGVRRHVLVLVSAIINSMFEHVCAHVHINEPNPAHVTW